MHNYKKLIVTLILYSHLFSDGGSIIGKGINEKKGPSSNVNPIFLNSNGGLIKIISVNSCFKIGEDS